VKFILLGALIFPTGVDAGGVVRFYCHSQNAELAYYNFFDSPVGGQGLYTVLHGKKEIFSQDEGVPEYDELITTARFFHQGRVFQVEQSEPGEPLLFTLRVKLFGEESIEVERGGCSTRQSGAAPAS
jgi:hypothetical protein